jgi:hypothetical protein
MELSLEDRELQIYDSMSGNELYAKGGTIKTSAELDEWHRQLNVEALEVIHDGDLNTWVVDSWYYDMPLSEKRDWYKKINEMGLDYPISAKKLTKNLDDEILKEIEDEISKGKFSKGGLVKKSDFTMLGLGALGGILIGMLKK